jgi:hypothetical protein
MSDYASIVDRAREASATVSRLEAALSRAPEDPAIQINLAAAKKWLFVLTRLLSVCRVDKRKRCVAIDSYRVKRSTMASPLFRSLCLDIKIYLVRYTIEKEWYKSKCDSWKAGFNGECARVCVFI